MNWFTMLVSTIIIVSVNIYRIYDKYYIKRDTKKNSELQLKMISKAIDNMNGREFEEFIFELLQRCGYKSTMLTGITRDGGYDLSYRDKYGKVLVECKHYNSVIPSDFIHKLISVCVCNGVDRGLFITTSSYSKDCLDIIRKCKAVKIEIWDKSNILELCESVNMSGLLEWLDYESVVTN
jgi:HJR/Mrr/RecB family endonuclease